MSAFPPEQTRAMRDVASQPNGSLAERWEDMHAQAAQLASLAHLAPEQNDGDLAKVPAMLGEADEWQRELAWQALEDIDAMMQPGMVALRTILARGQDANAPALALWREFHAARASVVDLVRQSGAQ
ncbi:MAG: hypothetical protein AAGL10_06250 [Pseudomonadota bacterium]